ncbi:tripartite tricarboxylate transporter substrate-binding protein [Chenggangzhangella methanolivorans]|uniref:Tripartite tricarboxylate transporter substrate binding protein BugD n=1 Tax=Chenggangzhangella methanolivorans TaxID=1437009 RepID=A0A9E6REH9_9HYPH|nr:tripartite tricarboxylate transporter substrate-binding protein [Chenggangzhangella methanolivorans]QZN99735.1 tripartite tricarboxylate transporter substrate binding protein BugD [Chenggangzhangella methanolivorans]
MRFGKAAAAAVFGLALAMGPARAEFPSGPVTLLVPFAAGGPTDVVARLVAKVMERELGKPVLVENATGAGGTLASGRLARSTPDGQTVLLHHMGITTSATLYRKLAYDPKTAFDFVGQVTTVPMLLVSRPDFPPADFKALLAYLKDNKDKVTLANAGPGAVSHVCGMYFMQLTGIKLTTVPYKGTGPAMTDTMGGQVDLLCDQTTGATGPVKNHKVKAYATATRERIAVLPDVPTAAEQGLNGFEVGVWHGMYVPAGTPKPTIDKLSAALKAALHDPEVKQRFADLGTAPVTDEEATPENLKAKYFSELDRWAPIIKAAGEFAD